MSVAVVDPILLLKELIRCPSVTPQTAGVFDVLEAALAPLGFTVTRLRFEGDGSYPVDNLFATRGSGAPHLLFAGHTDVVPPGDIATWSHDPFAADEADGAIYGRGAADMKSGIAAFVAAAAKPVGGGTLSLAITNDEEADAVNGTAKLMAWAATQGHRFDFAIVGEPSSSTRVGDSIKIGRRGSFNAEIAVIGTQGHVAYPDKANNPLPIAAAVVTALSAGHLDDGTAHFPPSNLEVTSIDVGNEVTNVIPTRARIRFNIRYNDQHTQDSLKELVEARAAAASGNRIRQRIEWEPSNSNVFITKPGPFTALVVEAIHEVTGRKPDLNTGGGTSDARFISHYCPVLEFGLVGQTMHQVDERVAVKDLERLTKIYRGALERYFA